MPVAIIAVREIAVSVYRTVVAGQGISVPAMPLAKVKTVAQQVAVALGAVPAHRGRRHVDVAPSRCGSPCVLTVVTGVALLRRRRASYERARRCRAGARRMSPVPIQDPTTFGSAMAPRSAWKRRTCRRPGGWRPCGRRRSVTSWRSPQRPGMISLAGGLPAPDSFPVDELREVTDRLLRERPDALLQYSTTEGAPELRAWVAEQAAADRCRAVEPEQVLVTHGSQQALDLVAKVFVDPGVTVAIDEPGYVGAIQALSVFEPRFLPVPVDTDGLDVDALEGMLAAGERPRLVYTVVNFQNPTGATLALDRRRRLAELAERYGFLVVEDDPYHALRFAGEHLPSTAAWTDNIVTLGTFSKLVVPGLRVGYVVAPLWLREGLAKVKQGADLHTSSWGQVLLAELVRRAGLARPRTSRSWWRSTAPAPVRWPTPWSATSASASPSSRPDGGMFLWGRLAGGVDARPLLAAALERDVAFVPGDAFYTGEPDAADAAPQLRHGHAGRARRRRPPARRRARRPRGPDRGSGSRGGRSHDGRRPRRRAGAACAPRRRSCSVGA